MTGVTPPEACNVATRFEVALPPTLVTPKLIVTVSPGSTTPLAGEQLSALGADAVPAIRTGDGLLEVIVRFAFEMSKKILLTASTLIRPCVVAVFGIVTNALPLFGTLLARTTGNVEPPLVENEIFTFAQLMGAVLVLATFQVTVCCDPPGIVAGLFGAVIMKGPAVLTDDTVVEA